MRKFHMPMWFMTGERANDQSGRLPEQSEETDWGKQMQKGISLKNGRAVRPAHWLVLLLIMTVITGCSAGTELLSDPFTAEHQPGEQIQVTGETAGQGASSGGNQETAGQPGDKATESLTGTEPQGGAAVGQQDVNPGSGQSQIPEERYIVVLDPGHGDRFSGAVYDGKKEKELNLKIAQYAKAYLETNYQAFTVYLTREEDVLLDQDQGADLRLRVELAEELGADILVSLHLNASTDHTQSGAAVYCPHRVNVKTEAFRLADNILYELEALGIRNNGAQKRNSNDTFDEAGNPVEYYAINRHAADRNLVGVIVEHCFMDNSADAAWIADEEALQALGEADARGIAAFFGLGL